MHALAEPTKLEALKREYVTKKSELKDEAKSKIFDEYGGLEHLQNAPPRELIFSQTEAYVEYSRSGKVIRGQESNAVKSRYEEDVFINNHTSVFGSFWREGKWGYKCCHNFVKNSYCTGKCLVILLLRNFHFVESLTRLNRFGKFAIFSFSKAIQPYVLSFF